MHYRLVVLVILLLACQQTPVDPWNQEVPKAQHEDLSYQSPDSADDSKGITLAGWQQFATPRTFIGSSQRYFYPTAAMPGAAYQTATYQTATYQTATYPMVPHNTGVPGAAAPVRQHALIYAAPAIRAQPRLIQLAPGEGQVRTFQPALAPQPPNGPPPATTGRPRTSKFDYSGLHSQLKLRQKLLYDSFGNTIEIIRAFTDGGLNAGVYQVRVSNLTSGRAPYEAVLRFEMREPEIQSKHSAQQLLKGKPHFAQVEDTGAFMVMQEDGRFKRYIGQLIELGGDSLVQSDKQPLKSTGQRTAESILAAGRELNALGVFFGDIKAQNMVARLRSTLGEVMVIDFADALDTKQLRGRDYVGPVTFIPPEATTGILSSMDADTRYATMCANINSLLRGDVQNLYKMNTWLFGHAIFQSITGQSFNSFGKAGVTSYPSKDLLTATLTKAAQVKGNEWLLVHLHTIVNMLHPNPTLRPTIEESLSALQSGAPVPTLSW